MPDFWGPQCDRCWWPEDDPWRPEHRDGGDWRPEHGDGPHELPGGEHEGGFGGEGEREGGFGVAPGALIGGESDAGPVDVLPAGDVTADFGALPTEVPSDLPTDEQLLP